MANYHRRPLVAVSEEQHKVTWLTPDGAFKIVHDRVCPAEKDCYILRERHISRLGDGHMRVMWVEVLAHVDRSIIQEALNVILYPYGSEPSVEHANLWEPEIDQHDDGYFDIPRQDIDHG